MRGLHHSVPRQRFQRSSRRSSSPNRGWAGEVDPVPVSLAAGNKVLAAAIVLDNQGIDETILRTIGSISVGSDQSAATEFQLGAVGFCLVTDTALAAGIASIPDPVTDVEDDIWFVHKSFSREFLFGTAVGFAPDFMETFTFESRAKRIFHTGNSIAVVVANAHATHGLKFALNWRMLTMVRGTR